MSITEWRIKALYNKTLLLSHCSLIYWTDMGAPGKIEAIRHDGRHRVTIATDNITTPISITIDYQNQRLLWIDSTRQVCSLFCFINLGPHHGSVSRRILHLLTFIIRHLQLPFSAYFVHFSNFCASWVSEGCLHGVHTCISNHSLLTHKVHSHQLFCFTFK